LLPAAVIPAALVVTEHRRRLLLQAVVAVMLSAALIGSWLYRNHRIAGTATIEARDGKAVSSKFLRNYRLKAENGLLFSPKRHKYFYGDDWKEEQEKYERAMQGQVKDPSQSDVEFWLRHPGLLAKYSVIRCLGLFMPNSWSETFGLKDDLGEYLESGAYLEFGAKAGMLLLDVLVLAVGALAFLASLHPKNRRLWIVTSTVTYFVLIYSLIHGITRYRVAILPLIIVLVVWWLSTLRLPGRAAATVAIGGAGSQQK
jgi:hypothetical protein